VSRGAVLPSLVAGAVVGPRAPPSRRAPVKAPQRRARRSRRLAAEPARRRPSPLRHQNLRRARAFGSTVMSWEGYRRLPGSAWGMAAAPRPSLDLQSQGLGLHGTHRDVSKEHLQVYLDDSSSVTTGAAPRWPRSRRCSAWGRFTSRAPIAGSPSRGSGGSLSPPD